MPHVIEAAVSGRAKCRGCGERIDKGDLRFGERLPNPYGDGEMTLWFHPLCAAYKRPGPLLELLDPAAELPPAAEVPAAEIPPAGEVPAAEVPPAGEARRGGDVPPTEEALETLGGDLEALEGLRAEAEKGVAHRRLPRIDGGQRAPTGRARCRCCRELIEKGAWRIPLVYFEGARFQPSGFIHVGCSREYFETDEVVGRVLHFAPGLTQQDLEELQLELDRAARDDGS